MLQKSLPDNCCHSFQSDHTAGTWHSNPTGRTNPMKCMFFPENDRCSPRVREICRSNHPAAGNNLLSIGCGWFISRSEASRGVCSGRAVLSIWAEWVGVNPWAARALFMHLWCVLWVRTWNFHWPLNPQQGKQRSMERFRSMVLVMQLHEKGGGGVVASKRRPSWGGRMAPVVIMMIASPIWRHADWGVGRGWGEKNKMNECLHMSN